MDKRKDLTKELLADCFRELMQTMSFEKITIKMITDRAGLIRPTFYKHFQDKYEVLEWIFQNDVGANVDLLIDNHMEYDAVVMFCRCLDRDRAFYRRAYQMEPGPNSFDNILTRYVYDCFMRVASNRSITAGKKFSFVTNETLASYYTYGFVNIVRDWIVNKNDVSAESLAECYRYLMTHSIQDLVNGH